MTLVKWRNTCPVGFYWCALPRELRHRRRLDWGPRMGWASSLSDSRSVFVANLPSGLTHLSSSSGRQSLPPGNDVTAL